MPITEEQQAAILKSRGLKPWQARIVETPDGGGVIEPINTTASNPVGAFARFGAEALPHGAVGMLGMRAGQAIASPLVAGSGLVTGGTGAAVAQIGSGLAGGMAADALYSATPIAESLHKFILGSPEQEMRDREEHPIATRLGGALGMVGGFRPLNKAGLSTLGSGLKSLAQQVPRTLEESGALKQAGLNAALGGGIEAIRQGYQAVKQGSFDPISLGDIALQAGVGTAFGKPWGPDAKPFGVKPEFGAKPNTTVQQPATPSIEGGPATTATAPESIPAKDLQLERPQTLQQLRNIGPRVALAAPETSTATMNLGKAAESVATTAGGPQPGVRLLQPGQEPSYRPEPMVREEADPSVTADTLRSIREAQAAREAEAVRANVANQLADQQAAQVAEQQRQMIEAQRQLTAEQLGRPTQNLVTEPELPFGAVQEGLPPPRPPRRRLPMSEEDQALELLRRIGRVTDVESTADSPDMGTRFRSFQPAADQPTPEPVQVLAEAVGAAANPTTTKKAAFIPAGSEIPPLGELVPLQHPKGVVAANMEKMTPAEAEASVAGEQIKGTDLGLSQDTKPVNPAAAVVTDRPGAPAVLTEIVESPQAAEKAIAAQRLAVPGGTQRVVDPAEVIAQRESLIRQRKPLTVPYDASQVPEAVQVPRDQPPRLAEEMAGRGATEVQPPPQAAVPPPAEVAAPFDPSVPSGELEHVPLSIVKSLSKVSPEAADRVSAFNTRQGQIYGKHFNTILDELRPVKNTALNDLAERRLAAYRLKQPLQLAPEEVALNERLNRMMHETAVDARRAGYPINERENYWPEMPSTAAARELERHGKAFEAEHWPEVDALNSKIYGADYDPADAAVWWNEYLEGLAKAPNSMGAEFGALTKAKRQYHLPDSIRDKDAKSVIQRYGRRYSQQIAKRQIIESSPETMEVLYGSATPGDLTNLDAVMPQARNARMAVDNVLFNEGRGTSGLGQDAKDLAAAAQQLTYSGAMGTLTATRNLIQSLPYHAALAVQTPGGLKSLAKATLGSQLEWHAQRQKALESGIMRPGHDPRMLAEDAGIQQQMARTMSDTALKVRKVTLGEMLENLGRVRDFTYGEGLAEINMELIKHGDPSAQQFFKRFGAGVEAGMTHQEAVLTMARNYAEAAQSSYSAVGLPAPMLKGGVVGTLTRIQRFGWENMMRTYQYIVKPAAKGDYMPLLTYLAGNAIALPVLKKIAEQFTGKEDNLLKQGEIAAGKKEPLFENILNIMASAQLTGAFGTIGSVAGNVANSVRGSVQPLVGDPLISFGRDMYMNLLAASEAVRQGEPPVASIEEAVKRSLLNNIQLLRRFSKAPGEAQDMRNKRVFQYLNEKKHTTIPEMGGGMLLGAFAPGYTPEISPTMDAARAGDKAALKKISSEDRKRLDNYRGGFEDPKVEAQYQGFLKKARGPDSLEEYLARRRGFKKAAGMIRE